MTPQRYTIYETDDGSAYLGPYFRGEWLRAAEVIEAVSALQRYSVCESWGCPDMDTDTDGAYLRLEDVLALFEDKLT